jgi:hypothetical protein
LNPELYQKLRNKYPDGTDTWLITKGLEYLLSGNISDNDKNINLSKLKQEVWTQFVEKCKNSGKTKEIVVGELVFKWIKGNVEI